MVNGRHFPEIRRTVNERTSPPPSRLFDHPSIMPTATKTVDQSKLPDVAPVPLRLGKDQALAGYSPHHLLHVNPFLAVKKFGYPGVIERII